MWRQNGCLCPRLVDEGLKRNNKEMYEQSRHENRNFNTFIIYIIFNKYVKNQSYLELKQAAEVPVSPEVSFY